MLRKRAALLLIIAMLAALAIPVGAADAPAVKLEAPETVRAGTSFEVRVLIEHNPGLNAVQFTVGYDQKVARCDTCSTGEVLKGTLSATNANGKDGAVVAAASATSVTGDGTLAVLKFTALADGKPELRLNDTVFANAEGGKITVSVSSSSTVGDKDTDKPFTDTDGSFAKDAIEEAAKLGLILGYDGKYRPDDEMTRGECVTILYRAMGSPKVEKAATFTDLTRAYYRDAIAWAEQTGAVKGVGNGKFDPEGKVTRAQLATILYRLAGSESGMELLLAGAYDRAFTDADEIPNYAKTAVYWAVYKNIWCGVDSLDTGTELAPRANATRAQIAVMITRYLEQYPTQTP